MQQTPQRAVQQHPHPLHQQPPQPQQKPQQKPQQQPKPSQHHTVQPSQHLGVQPPKAQQSYQQPEQQTGNTWQPKNNEISNNDSIWQQNDVSNVQASSDDQANLWRSDVEESAPTTTSEWDRNQAEAEDSEWKSDPSLGLSRMVSGAWDQKQDEQIGNLNQTMEKELRVINTNTCDFFFMLYVKKFKKS